MGRNAAKRTSPKRAPGARREGRTDVPPEGPKTTVTTATPDPGKPTPPASGTAPSVNKFEEFKRFMKSVQVEWKRVTWPSRKELRMATIVVLVTLVIFSTYLGVLDWLFSRLFIK